MPLLIDHTDDYLYKQGIVNTQDDNIKRMLSLGIFTLQQIASSLDMPLETVKEINEKDKYPHNLIAVGDFSYEREALKS